MRAALVSVGLAAATLLSACASNPQGTDEVRDVQFFAKNTDSLMEHEPKRSRNLQSDNPMQINQVGETWGLKKDKEKVFEAVDTLEGVTVRRVTFNKDVVRVRVTVEEDIKSNDERMVKAKKIKTAIQRALPRYNIRVKIVD
ncbi:hypothetical protein N780_13800 [Pontibacillus chungwhensis BH030062]|uniref:Sporulation protein n=1 Tax=Pontibacillus chungwhensis BH030062 TaxID=1385513 RepID=A0A0A2UX18_9BACI|nr:hypothetical protein [Pontibacillus chungwhensis]KGP92464.1 hypothetical protein N780_13800 [Pontibacillus chungwhensis BH030062]